MTAAQHTIRIKEEARRLGFDACGIAAATQLDDKWFSWHNAVHGKSF
jgi:hypothetical protein